MNTLWEPNFQTGDLVRQILFIARFIAAGVLLDVTVAFLYLLRRAVLRFPFQFFRLLTAFFLVTHALLLPIDASTKMLAPFPWNWLLRLAAEQCVHRFPPAAEFLLVNLVVDVVAALLGNDQPSLPENS